MSAEAYHHYDDLHRLVDRLDQAQADAVRAVILQLVKTDPGSAAPGEPDDAWPPSWFGSIATDETDVAARSREILREEYGTS